MADPVEIPEKYWCEGTSGTMFDPETLRAFAEMHRRHPFDHDVLVKAGIILFLLDAFTNGYPTEEAYDKVCECFHNERKKLREVQEAIGKALYALDPNQGEKSNPVDALIWLRTTLPSEHPNYLTNVKAVELVER